MVAIEVSAEYARVLFVLVAASFQLLMDGFAAGILRSKIFNKDFIKANFSAEEARQLSDGYPDMGHGRVADKLSFADWFKFNSAQRAHYNYLEGFPTFAVCLLVAAVWAPNPAFILGSMYVIGRQFYSIGYRSKGSKGRFVGVLIMDVALLSLIGMAFYNAFQAGGGVKGFQQVYVGAAQQAEGLVKELIAKYAN